MSTKEYDDLKRKAEKEKNEAGRAQKDADMTQAHVRLIDNLEERTGVSKNILTKFDTISLADFFNEVSFQPPIAKVVGLSMIFFAAAASLASPLGSFISISTPQSPENQYLIAGAAFVLGGIVQGIAALGRMSRRRAVENTVKDITQRAAEGKYTNPAPT